MQAPGDTRGYNRYAYVRNNPMNATDPSGYISLKRFHRGVMWATGVWETHRLLNKYCASCPPVIAAGLSFVPVFGVFLSVAFTANNTFYITGSFTDTFKGAAISFASSAIFSGIGATKFGGNFWSDHIGRSLMHGVAGGVLAELQGGEFSHGFVSAAATKLMDVNGGMGMESADYDGLRVLTAALIGGAISEHTGGKFANGAATAAIAQIYNGNPQLAAKRPQKARFLTN